MPRRKGKKLTVKKSSPRKSSLKASKNMDRDSLNYMKTWLDGIQKASPDYQYDSELIEINTDEDSEEFECNLKELEKPLKTLLKGYPDSVIKKRVSFECEWDKCSFETNEETTYFNHVHDHVMTNDAHNCLWNLCKYETEDEKDLLRHLDYHAYHTVLKTFGLGLANIISIPNCQAGSKLRNVIPSIPDDYFCYWKGCSESFSKFKEFTEHIGNHLKVDYHRGFPTRRGDTSEEKVACHWDGCQRELPNVFELKRHMKRHTNEKMIGCANCGKLFATKPLLIDHCIRQVVNQRSFQCPDCYKLYPSQKLLNDHTRVHVNKFQCNFCGLSCQKKSVLARHIRYRHMTDKPFACEDCKYKGKTKRDLEAHQKIHDRDNVYNCEVFQCNYTSRTLMALKRHDAKEHLHQPQTYQCHCCDNKYLRGHLLSKHLIKDHMFRLAPGHSRFIYKEDLDGFHRLQTKRVENLKDGNQPLVSPSVDDDSNMNVSYEIDKISDTPMNTTINVRLKKVVRPKPLDVPTFSLFTGISGEDSKDINDFAVVKNYKTSIKKKPTSR